jgi:hypothetical protein
MNKSVIIKYFEALNTEIMYNIFLIYTGMN